VIARAFTHNSRVLNNYPLRLLTEATSEGEPIMDAKYNWLIDSGAVRVTLNTVAFALWMVMALGLLELAAKV